MSDETQDTVVSDFMKRWEQEKAESRKATKRILETVWPLLESSPLSAIDLEYYGSGDSGGFEEVHFHFKDGSESRHHSLSWGQQENFPWDDLGLPKVPVLRQHQYWQGHELVIEDQRIVQDDIINAMIEVAESFLSYHHSGWENNDGGRGEVTFDIENRKMTLHHQEYYTETANYEHDFGADEEDDNAPS